MHDFTLHPTLFSLNSQPVLGNIKTFYIAIMTDKEIAKRLQNILLWCFENKKVLNFFSDRHGLFLLTDNTVVHNYNIHNHIAREYGHKMGSNVDVSLVPMFHGSCTSPISNSRSCLTVYYSFMFAYRTTPPALVKESTWTKLQLGIKCTSDVVRPRLRLHQKSWDRDLKFETKTADLKICAFHRK